MASNEKHPATVMKSVLSFFVIAVCMHIYSHVTVHFCDTVWAESRQQYNFVFFFLALLAVGCTETVTKIV